MLVMLLLLSIDFFDVFYNGCLNVYVEFFDFVYEVFFFFILDGIV